MKYIKITALGICMALGLLSCNREEFKGSNAVATEYSSMEFAAVEAEPQILPVYSDGDWTIENDSDWVDVTPMSGFGNMEVTVTVADNIDGTEVDLPRKAKISFRSGSSSPDQNCSVTINQKGDKYKGLTPVDVRQAKDLEKEAVAKFTRVQVMATALTGMVIGDDSGVIYVEGTVDNVKAGDLLALTGDVKAGDSSEPNVVVLDPESVNFLGEGTADYSGAKNVTSDIDSYEGSYLELVSVKGSIIGLANEDVLAGAAIRVPGATKRMMVGEAAPSMKMADVNYHFVTVAGYFSGNMGANPSFIPAKVLEDGGVDEAVIPVPKDPNTILFEDNFDWMDAFVQAAKAAGTDIGDSVGENNASGAAPNAYTTTSLAGLLAEMSKIGYADVNAGVTSIYPQDGYWKFGKTSAHTGLQLPSIDYYGDLEVSFDWSPHMTGSGNIDKIILVVKVVTGNSTVIAGQYSYEAWEKGQLAWHPAKAKVQITPESLIQICPVSLEDYNGITQQRFYLDNIVVKVPGPDVDPVYANIQVDEDVLTFEGEGGEKVLRITSDQDFYANTADKWIILENAKGMQNTETEVTVRVEASDLSKLREGKITIISADSEKTIRVIQSAAGQDLKPFVSLGKNKAEVTYREQEIDVEVQATEDYTITSDASWVTVKPQVETKGMVEQKSETLIIAANEDKTSKRVAHVTFAIASKGVESVLTIVQAAAPEENPNLLLIEDFDWMKQYFPAYEVASGKKVGDTMAEQNASANSPQIYAAEFPDAIREEFAARGWSDLNPSGKMVYINDAYLKLSKTGGNNTAVALSMAQYLGGKSDLVIDFDYAMQIQGSGTVDVGPVVLCIDGDGVFENGTKVSDQFNSTQAKGELAWQNVTGVKIKGATRDTRIIWVNGRVLNADGTFNWSVSGAGRFFLDNIRIDHHDYLWDDDFSWLSEMIAAYNEAYPTNHIGNPTDYKPEEFKLASNANAPNAYTVEPFKSYFPDALAKAGYTDMAKKAINQNALYPQDCHLKLGLTSKHTSLQFAPFTSVEGSTNAILSFDWCRHVQGTAKIDPVELVAVIEGDGTFENGKKISDPLTTPQEYVENVSAQMFWTNSSVKIEGATSGTKINIVYKDCLNADGTYNWTVSGAHRYHIDNIVVTR